jgi:hypothetical protein
MADSFDSHSKTQPSSEVLLAYLSDKSISPIRFDSFAQETERWSFVNYWKAQIQQS